LGVIALIAVLGLGGIMVSRNDRSNHINAAGKGGHPPVVNQNPPWHQGYAVYECGKFAAPITSKNNPEGIYTSQPGIITISPKVDSAAGKNATLGKFASAVGMTLNAAELQLPGGKQWLNQDTCQGEPGHVYVRQFPYPGAPASSGQLYNGNTKKCQTGETGTGCGQLPKLNPADVPLGDQQLVTIAFVPASKAGSIPPPPTDVQNTLSKLSASSTSTTTTVPGATSATTKPTTSTTKK
jgi:hypothetical protein